MEELVRPKADAALGWAFRPDSATVTALARGRSKLKNHTYLGADRPHHGQSLEAFKEERRAKRRRRKQVVKKVSKKGKAVAAKPTSKKKTVEAKPQSGRMIPLKSLCAELDLDPKATRVKLRRMIANDEIDFHDHSQRWEFTPTQAKAIRQALAE